MRHGNLTELRLLAEDVEDFGRIELTKVCGMMEHVEHRTGIQLTEHLAGLGVKPRVDTTRKQKGPWEMHQNVNFNTASP